MVETGNALVPTDEGGNALVPIEEREKGDLKQRAVTRGHEMWYRASQLQPRGHNLRQWHLTRNKKKVIEFAQTAYKGGIRVPISVSLEDRQILIDHGETRWLAVKLLEGDDIHNVLEGETDPDILSLLGAAPKDKILLPAVPSPKKLNKIDRLRDTLITNTGQGFLDLELANGIKQFMDWGMKQSEIADYLGGKAANPPWTQTRVSHIRQLYDASPRLRDLLGNEVVTTTVVIDALRIHGENAEEVVLAAIEDAKAKAAAEAAQLEEQAKEAQAEVQQLIATGEADAPAPVAPGEPVVTKREAAQRRATEASAKAEAAKKRAKTGPKRVTGREVTQAAARRTPDAPSAGVVLSRAAQAAFIGAVQFEAQFSQHAPTRTRMNNLLKLYGFPELTARVDDAGNEVVAEANEAAAA